MGKVGPERDASEGERVTKKRRGEGRKGGMEEERPERGVRKREGSRVYSFFAGRKEHCRPATNRMKSNHCLGDDLSPLFSQNLWLRWDKLGFGESKP